MVHICIFEKKHPIMTTSEIRECIIQNVLRTNDLQLLEYLNDLLNNNEINETYKLPDFEKRILNESMNDYKASNTISSEEVLKEMKNG